jgi:2-polyprenyl-6-methoxyphenol hydroxylase-like FAD-dependent oxidoreductase
MFDVIVVGARLAGAGTAMLLARRGLNVLMVERSSLPSDTLSSHQMQLPAAARLARWGLLDAVLASGAPPARQVRFHTPEVVLAGSFPTVDGVDAVYSPRRQILDQILLEAALAAGAQLRTRATVEQVSVQDGRAHLEGRDKGGGSWSETARFVVGADGRHSAVARMLGAPIRRSEPARSIATYTYWDGVPLDGAEVHNLDRRAVGAWPTNDGLVMTYMAWPAAELDRLRADVEGHLLSTLDQAGTLGQRVRAGRRAERIRTTPDVGSAVRKPYGPGWALAGDAGLVMDPITGQGIGHALRDAELLAQALGDGFDGRRPFAQALAAYEQERDRQTLPMYDFTTDLAALEPASPQARVLFRALADRPDEVTRFLGVLTGTESVTDFFAPGHLRQVVGLRGLAQIIVAHARGGRRGAHAPAAARAS